MTAKNTFVWVQLKMFCFVIKGERKKLFENC